MKKITLFVVLGTLFLCSGTYAQNVNTDSLSLISKISGNRVKLGHLQNEVDEKTKNKTDAGKKAQESANENSEAAKKLSDNPTDKKLSRKADNKAGDARSDARSSRKEARRLVSLNNDIANLKNKINKDQAKLDVLTGNITPQIN